MALNPLRSLEEWLPDNGVVSADQRLVVAALESGAASGDAGPLERIDTPTSHVFLGSRHVYKLKRSRRLPFVDLSTVEHRRRMCEAELGVNRALAPELYEAVRPVVRTPTGALRIGGDGEVLDWIVQTRRFPDGQLFDEIARAGQLSEAHVAEACDAIAAFHARLPAHRETGHTADYRRTIAGLRKAETEAAAALGLAPASGPLFGALDREALRQSELIEVRRRQGWVRRGHGDLHLRNICVFNGRATPFDALEFDPALATTDVLYDFAFLLMDLRARGLDALANRAMNRYFDVSGTPAEALALLPFFMALRAAVRMAVAVGGGSLGEADDYRRLGVRLLRPTRPLLVAIGGLSGSGKSAVAAQVAPRLPGCCGARLLRTDVLRKSRLGASSAAALPADAYTRAARTAVYRRLAREAQASLEADCPVVADATFQTQGARTMIEAAGRGRRFTAVWLRASAARRAARVAQRRGDASDATAALALAQKEPKALGAAWTAIDAEAAVHAVADAVLRQVGAGPVRA